MKIMTQEAPTCGLDGTEPNLRPDEAVCSVTNLTYNKHLPRSPHIDESHNPL